MSHESRDWKRSHDSDDDRSNYSADHDEQDEASRSSRESGRLHRHDRSHRTDREDRSDDDSGGDYERRHQSASSHDFRRSSEDDVESDRSSDRSGRQGTGDDDGPRHRDPAKFVSYNDEPASEDDVEGAARSSSERRSDEEPVRRPYSRFWSGARRDAAEPGSLPQATATRRAAGQSPSEFSAANHAALADASPIYTGSGLHPYDNHRAILIGMSTALVAAIAVIVALMVNLSSNRGPSQTDQADRTQYEARLAAVQQQDRKQYEDRLAAIQQTMKETEALAAQRAREARLAADQAMQSQRLAQAKEQAYLASQEELRRRQESERQLQLQDRTRQEENLRRAYVTQIRLAKQAWDRGDINQVLQLLEPYRNEEARKQYGSFAWHYLWRAARSGGSSTLRGHSDVVRQAVLTPDGSQIVTFSDDGQLIVWDAAAGRKLGSMALERNVPPRSAGVIIEDQLLRRASGLAVSGEGNWAAAYGRNLYLGANIRQPDAVRPVNDHAAPIISLSMSRDGKRVATGDYAGEIVVRDAADGRALRRFHNARPQALALSSDGGLLFAGMHDGALFVWDANKGDLLGTRAFGDRINSMALTSDSATLALAMGVRDGVVRLWEPGTGRFRGDLRGHHDEVTRVVWSRDGKSLLTASRDQTVCLWSSNGALLRTFRGHLGDVEAAAFAPDGQRIVSAGSDQSAILWNVDGGQPCDVLTDTPIDGWISGLAFTPDSGQVVGTGSCDGAGESFEAFLTSWSLNEANRPGPLQTSSRSGVALAFSPDGRQMVVGESAPPDSKVKSRVRIWSLDPPRVLATVPKLVGSVYSAAYSGDGRYLAVGVGDDEERVAGTVLIVEPATGALRQKLPELPGRVDAMFSVDSRFLITVNGSKRRPSAIRFWNPATAELAGQIENPAELAGLTTTALSPDGRYLLTGHGDPTNPATADKAKIKVWDLATRQLAAQFPAAHPAAITRLEFSRRGMLLASGDMAGNVRVWEFATRKLLPKQIATQGRPITHIAFDKLGDRIAVAADEKCVRVWHVDSAQQLAILELALGVPNVVRFTQDGKMLAAATSAGGLFLWDAGSYKPHAILRGEGNPAGQQGHGGVITCVAPLLSDKLLTGSVDKTVRIWDLKTRKAVATAFTFNQAVSCMAVSPDGRTLAVGTGKYRSRFETGELVLCDLEGKRQPKTISQGITPVSLAFSPDGNLLAVSSLSAAVGNAARSVSVIDLRTGHATPIGSPAGHSVAFSPEGRFLAVGSASGQIDLWPMEGPGSAKPIILKKHQALIWALAFSPDGRTLASGGADNNVTLWDTATCEDLMTLKHNGVVEALRFSPDGRILASASHEPTRGTVCLWRAPIDDEASPRNTSRTAVGVSGGVERPSGLDAGTAMRPSYADPVTTPPNVPLATPSGPVAPTPSLVPAVSPAALGPEPPSRAAELAPMPNYVRAEDDRYGPVAPSPRTADRRSSNDQAGEGPSAPLQNGGFVPADTRTEPANNPLPASGSAMPADGSRPDGARRPRPVF